MIEKATSILTNTASKLVMVVEILIPLTQGMDALTQQRQLVMHDIAGIAGVGEPRIDRLEQPQPSIDLPEQQQATIAGDIPA